MTTFDSKYATAPYENMFAAVDHVAETLYSRLHSVDFNIGDGAEISIAINSASNSDSKYVSINVYDDEGEDGYDFKIRVSNHGAFNSRSRDNDIFINTETFIEFTGDMAVDLDDDEMNDVIDWAVEQAINHINEAIL